MKRALRWRDHVAVNIYWLGLNTVSGTITPVLLPYLVALYVPDTQKNTYLAAIRVAGLAVAMTIQPLAGMISDRSTLRWGRRRPFILAGSLFDLLFLLLIGASPLFANMFLDGRSDSPDGVSLAYFVLLVGILLLQTSSNVAHGALQGLIPDLVPQKQRGRSSGVKAVMELLPSFVIIFLGPLVDAGRIGLTMVIVATVLSLTMLATLLWVREERLEDPPPRMPVRGALRLLALTAIFVGVTQAATWLVHSAGRLLETYGATLSLRVAAVGASGLTGMTVAVLVGVWLGARVGIGPRARHNRPFIWWVVNRLLFLAAVGSIQSFAQYFLRDVLLLENAVTVTTVLLGIVALFLIPAALGGGVLADRVGHRRVVGGAGLIAAAGTLLLLFSTDIPLVVASGCVIGTGTGLFMASNWALGTQLVPPGQAGKYLGISNLAGAGAGIVGAGIGGPLADFFNALSPGLGYLVIFAIYGSLFLLSTLSLTKVSPVQ